MAEADAPREYEGRDDTVDKSEFATERVGADFSACLAAQEHDIAGCASCSEGEGCSRAKENARLFEQANVRAYTRRDYAVSVRP